MPVISLEIKELTVRANIDGICSSDSASNHGSDTRSRRIMGMYMNRQIGILLPDRSNQQCCRTRFHNSRHILNPKNMNPRRNNLLHQAHIILQIILLVRIQHVATETNRSLANSTGFLHSVNPNHDILQIIQRVKHTENIDPVLLCLETEIVNRIIRQRRVSYTIRSTKQHLKRNIRNEFSKFTKSIPGILIQETHGDIERRATPHFKTVGVGESMTCLWGNIDEIDCTDAGCEQTLMGITPGCVHDETAFVGADGFGETFRSFLEEETSPAFGGRFGDVEEFA